MRIKKTKKYMLEFVQANASKYLKFMKEVGGCIYPEPYKGQHEVVVMMRDLAFAVDELANLSIPKVFATPLQLVDRLVWLRDLAEENRTKADAIGKRTDWMDDVTYLFETSNEITQATNYALSLLESTPAEASAIAKVTYLLSKLTSVAAGIKQRHKKNGISRPTLQVKDEYDVQDLLQGVLAIGFDDVRREIYTPSYAATTSRADFILVPEEMIIEVKMTRKGLSRTKLVQELIIDIAYYKNVANCKHLVCAIWDTGKLLTNPASLRDLEINNPGFVTVLVMH